MPLFPPLFSRSLVRHGPRHLLLSDTPYGQVMRNFSVNALYVFHEAVPVHASQERFRRASRSGKRAGRGACGGGSGGGGDKNGGAESRRESSGGDGDGDGDGDGVGLRRVHRPPVNRLRLDVPELSSELDSHQVRLKTLSHGSLSM